MALTAPERAALQRGLEALGLRLEGDAIERIGRHLAELRRWMPRVNLVSRRDAEALIERHVLDSLAAAPLLARTPAGGCIADVGSGAGFPGIPLAIALAPRRFLLVEPRRKRASFLRAVARAVAPVRIEVSECRLEDLVCSDLLKGLQGIVTRAAISDEEILARARAWLPPGGLVVAYRSVQREGRGDDPAAGFAGPEQRLYRFGPKGPARSLLVWTKTEE